MKQLKGIPIRLRYLIVISIIALFTILSGITFIHTFNTVSENLEHMSESQASGMDSKIENSDDSIAYNKQEIEDHFVNLFVIFLLSMLIIAFAVSLNAITTNRNLKQLLLFIKELEQGKNVARVDLGFSEEFREIASNLNNFLDKQDEKIRYLKTIGKGEIEDAYDPEASDILGHEIKIMADRLKHSRTEDEIRKSEESIRNWKAEGIASFADMLRSEREDMKELSFLIVQKIIQFLDIELGTLMIAEEEPGKGKKLVTLASYAYDRRKYINKEFLFGEGLPGSCALEQQRIYIDEVPEEYSDIISGVGQAKPRYVLVEPLKIENEIFGVIELASFRGLEQHELDFINQLAESIASTLMAVRTNESNAALLKQSQEQAEQLLQQEEKLVINLKALEQSQEESQKKETEITGIINAMNESSLVAEFSLNGRYRLLNDKYVQLFETPKEQILGKHHSEFAQIEKYSDEYKLFWEKLKNGETISKIEAVKMYSGKEIWLQQTFSPIKNKEGKVFKILNIAMDITLSQMQQEDLEKQSVEIIRQNLEMESMNEAVNTSIIKCELDSDGIILDANKNFETASGYTRKELLGRNYRLFLKDIEKDQFEKVWSEALKGKTYEGATRRTKPTGEEIWLMSTFSPVKDTEGVIYKIYFLALDITEKRLKYQLLEDANREIERLKKH